MRRNLILTLLVLLTISIFTTTAYAATKPSQKVKQRVNATDATLKYNSRAEMIRDLEREISELNKSLPIEIVGGGNLVKINYNKKENNLELYIDYSEQEDDVPISVLKDNIPLLKERTKLIMLGNTSSIDQKRMLKDDMDFNINFAYILFNPETSESVCIVLTPEDMEDVYTANISEKEIYRNIAKIDLEIDNQSLPEMINENTWYIKGYISGNDIVYIYNTTYDLIKFLNMKYVFDASGISNEIANETVESLVLDLDSNLLETIVKSEMDIVFRFLNEHTDDVAELRITNSQIREYLNAHPSQGK